MKNNIDEALKSLDQAEVDLLQQLERIKAAKNALIATSPSNLIKPEISQSKQSNSHYDTAWSYQDKFLYILKKENRFIHFRQAAEFIIETEGLKEDTNKITNKLSSATHLIKKNGTIVKIQGSTSNTDTFWGSPKWLDEKGNIKPEHDFDRKYLTFNKPLRPFIEI